MNPVLDALQLESPCPMKWADMAGDDRVRFCGRCELKVYDLSQLSADEACALVQRFEGRRLCVRMYRRRDGRVTTRDCTLAEKLRRRTQPWVGLGGVLGVALIAFIAVVALFAQNIRGLNAMTGSVSLSGAKP